MCARATIWRDAAFLRVFFSGILRSLTGQDKPGLTVGRVALGEPLVFNVASQKNAISDGFCPFLSRGKAAGTKRRQQVCMTHLFFGTVRKVYLVRSI